jgi:hypothetical protein
MEPAKQKLTPNDTFVRMPDISNDDDELKLSEAGSRKPPNLPKIKEINQFIALAKEVVKLPDRSKDKTVKDSGTISLDDMLEEPEILDLHRLPELLSLGLQLLPRIDSKFFEWRSEFRAPFDALKEEADLAKELVGAVKIATALSAKVYRTSFEELIKRIMIAIDHHRGDEVQRRVEGIDISSKLVVLEMCYDGGVAPRVELPEVGMYRDIDKAVSQRQSYRESEEAKTPERKKINYGRPESAKQDGDLGGEDEASIMARRKEKTAREMQADATKETAEDRRNYLHQSAVGEVRSFIARVRKPSTKFERFGALIISQQEASARDDAAAQKRFNSSLPSWIQHAVTVNEANVEKTELNPYLQGAAEQLVRAACKAIIYAEVCERNKPVRLGGTIEESYSLDNQKIMSWSIAGLQSSIKESVSWHRAYGHVVEVMEAIAPIAERSGLGKVLGEGESKLLKKLAPAVVPLPPEENAIFEKYLAKREEMALGLKVEMMARSIVAQNLDPGLAKYAEDSPDRLTYAREIALKKLTTGSKK